jgi:glutathione peroxidase
MVDEYGTKGLKILAFPCNQFGGQEPGTHEEILKFVEENFQAKDKFTFFEKADVNGKNAREVFSFLKQKLPSSDGTTDIRWNFGKFLVDHEGIPHKRFGPKTNPLAMKESIEELLKKIPEAKAEE